eukprot:4570144-Amphidinium_carterae.2
MRVRHDRNSPRKKQLAEPPLSLPRRKVTSMWTGTLSFVHSHTMYAYALYLTSTSDECKQRKLLEQMRCAL